MGWGRLDSFGWRTSVSVLKLSDGAVQVRGPEGEEGAARSQYAFQEGIEGRGGRRSDRLEESDGVAGCMVGLFLTGETGWCTCA